MASRSASVTCHLCCDRCAFAFIITGQVHDRHAFGAVNAVDSIYNIDYRKLGSFSVPMAFGIEMNTLRSTERWNDVPRGTMDEVRSYVRLDLPFV